MVIAKAVPTEQQDWHLHQLGNCVLTSLMYSSIKDTLSPLIYVQLGIHLTKIASCYCRICTFTINFYKGLFQIIGVHPYGGRDLCTVTLNTNKSARIIIKTNQFAHFTL